MTMERYEAIVVGGGPAGSAAAYTLASSGCSTCLIDKAAFPREKLCGGLITLRSKGIFENVFHRKWDEDILISSQDIWFYSKGKFLSRELNYSTLYFTMRVDFDAYLLGLARDAGAVLKLASKVSRIDFEKNHMYLESGEELAFRFLIGADGVNSQIASALFGVSFNPTKIGFGLEVEVPRSLLPNQEDRVEIDFGAARWGYGWVFPKKSTYTIGVGGIHRLNPNLRAELSEYLRRKGLHISDFRVKGQYIPFGDFRKRPFKNNVLLCGDAAGVVDPITGEGIAYAMQSGACAGGAIARGKAIADVQQTYLTEYRKVASSIRQASYWRNLIFPKPLQKPFAWAFSDASTLRHGYLDILAGKHDYDALYGLFLLQMRKAIRKLVSGGWNNLLSKLIFPKR